MTDGADSTLFPLDVHDVGIVGAGPIGLELAACLQRAGVDYVHFEARQIGHTFTWWPRDTSFFSTTERIEIAGIPISILCSHAGICGLSWTLSFFRGWYPHGRFRRSAGGSKL